MRAMVKTDSLKTVLKVERVLMLVNGWEYFLEKPNKEGIAFGLVCGFEDEMGDVYLPELVPHIVAESCGNLDGLMPAMGWEWVDEICG